MLKPTSGCIFLFTISWHWLFHVYVQWMSSDTLGIAIQTPSPWLHMHTHAYDKFLPEIGQFFSQVCNSDLCMDLH